MSVEKQPTPSSTPENNQKAREAVEGEWTAEQSARMEDVLSTENKSFFGKMSEAGKEVAGKAYEGVANLHAGTWTDRVKGRLQIAYHNEWMKFREGSDSTFYKGAADLKKEVDGIDMRVGFIDQNKQEIEALIAHLAEEKLPGGESLQVKLRDIEQQRNKYLNDRDRLQTRIEFRENKAKIYANKRDAIADRFIKRYDERLTPMEGKLEELQTSREQVDLLLAGLDAKQEEQRTKLDAIEKKKETIAETLRKSGDSERKIRKFEGIKLLEERLKEGRAALKEAEKRRLELVRQKDRIGQKIAKVDAKANPYRDRRQEFARAKEGRPIDMGMEERTRSADVTEREVPGAHFRDETTQRTAGDARGSSERSPVRPERVQEDTIERMRVEEYADRWNTFVKEKIPQDSPVKEIELQDFLAKVRDVGIWSTSRPEFGKFKEMLVRYYALTYKVKDRPRDMSRTRAKEEYVKRVEKALDEFYTHEKKKAGTS